jgi:hypothetical protein
MSILFKIDSNNVESRGRGDTLTVLPLPCLALHMPDKSTICNRFCLENSPTIKNVLTIFRDAGTTLAMSQNVQTAPPGIHYAKYETAKEAEYLPQIRQLISSDLSEPYSIYVYRYFLYQWADLCFMVRS